MVDASERLKSWWKAIDPALGKTITFQKGSAYNCVNAMTIKTGNDNNIGSKHRKS